MTRRQGGLGFMGFPADRRASVESWRQVRFQEACAASRREFLDEIERLADEGATLAAAAEHLGRTPGQVRRRLRSYGRGDLVERLAEGRMSLAELIEEAELLASSGVIVSVAAERLGVHPVNLARRLRAAGRGDLLVKMRAA